MRLCIDLSGSEHAYEDLALLGSAYEALATLADSAHNNGSAELCDAAAALSILNLLLKAVIQELAHYQLTQKH